MDLITSMKYLCDDSRMLTGIAVSYGTAAQHESNLYGRAQEMEMNADRLFIPCTRALEADSLYDLAPLTKMFTCVMTMLLVEKGQLSLSETIASIDSRFQHLDRTTVHDVLCFIAHLQTPGRIDAAETQEEARARLFGSCCAPPPRIRLYSDINAMVMKYVIEAKTNMSFGEALSQFVLSPLGMRDTYANVPEHMKRRCVCYNYEHRINQGKPVLRTSPHPGMPHDPKAAILSPDGKDLCGHAGLFSTLSDMTRFTQGLLSGKLLKRETLCTIGTNRTGIDYGDGTHRQYLGYLCFTRHPNQHLSEVPAWMGEHAFGLSGFTGNHLAIDPISNHFVLFLGNRCHGRVSNIQLVPGETLSAYGLCEDGTGTVQWADGRSVPSSARYVYFKDKCLHDPIKERMHALGWL